MNRHSSVDAFKRLLLADFCPSPRVVSTQKGRWETAIFDLELPFREIRLRCQSSDRVQPWQMQSKSFAVENNTSSSGSNFVYSQYPGKGPLVIMYSKRYFWTATELREAEFNSNLSPWLSAYSFRTRLSSSTTCSAASIRCRVCSFFWSLTLLAIDQPIYKQS